MTETTLEQANQALRAAVTERLNSSTTEPRVTTWSTETANSESYAEWLPPAYATPSAAEVLRRFNQPTSAATRAEQTLHSALAAVCDRHGKYGPPTEHFSRTVSLVNAAFGTTFTAADWALVMVLDKIARQLGPQATSDAAIDIAGYAACHEECRRA